MYHVGVGWTIEVKLDYPESSNFTGIRTRRGSGGVELVVTESRLRNISGKCGVEEKKVGVDGRLRRPR